MLREVRTRAGLAYVHARDNWFDPGTRHVVHERVRLMVSRRLSNSDVLDPQFERPLRPHPPVHVSEVSSSGQSLEWERWHVDASTDPTPWDSARACFAEKRVWPISFSYPHESLSLNPRPSVLVADIVPGIPYSFSDPEAYLATYRDAYLGLTHRKAGWDCFRHVEIMASGAVPLMLDADEIPRYSMIHYPKQALAAVASRARDTGAPPDEATREGFRTWFTRHLTSEAMARYVLEAAGLPDAKRVLFVDAALPGFADYQSVLTLIGLKQLLGRECHVMHPVDYVYDDTQAHTMSLYGRGFGYSRALPGAFRSLSELGEPMDLGTFDALVVGSVSRNVKLAKDLLAHFPAQKTICIH